MSPAATHKLPYRPPPCTAAEGRQGGKKKQRKETKERYNLGWPWPTPIATGGCPGPHPPWSSSLSHSPSSSRGGRVTVRPGFVSRRNCKTAGVASFVIEKQPDGRRSRVFPLAGLPDTFLQLFDLGLPSPALGEQVMSRLSLAAVAPPAFVGPDCFVVSARYGPIAAWPERSWKYRLATPLFPFWRSFRIFPPLGGRYRPRP